MEAGPFTFAIRGSGSVEDRRTVTPLLCVASSGSLPASIGNRRYSLARGAAWFVSERSASPDCAPGAAEWLEILVPPRFAIPGPIADATARAWALSLLREIEAGEPAWEWICEGLILQGLGRLRRIFELAEARPEWLDVVVGLAREQCALSDIARSVGRHPSHVAREFHRHEGVTVGEFARRCRLELAARELQGTRRSIADIAVGSGFCDQSHFTHAFHRLFGVTPAAYRDGAEG